MKEARSLPLESWPIEYQRALRRLSVPRRGRRSYSPATLASTQVGMGQYLATVQRAGLPLALSPEGLTAFVTDLDARKLSNASRLRYLANVQAIAKEIGYPVHYREILLEDCAIYRSDMQLDMPRKVTALQRKPLNLQDIRRASESARHASQTASSASRRRSLLQRAVLLRLLSYVPLRIGDVSRLIIGSTLLREPTGWRLSLLSGKTGFKYDTLLHQDLTGLLDALVFQEAGGTDIHMTCAQSHGRPLFHNQLGDPLSTQTLRMSFKAATGHTPHIVRTLVHDEMARLGSQGTALALDLCGQVSDGIERHYQVYAQRHRQTDAQEALSRLQRAILVDPALHIKLSG